MPTIANVLIALLAAGIIGTYVLIMLRVLREAERPSSKVPKTTPATEAHDAHHLPHPAAAHAH